jgi:hypothetical protein
MRHVRDFENTHTKKQVYCLFIAPRLHQDTAETFWIAIKHGYKGATQKIIPLSITQFIKLLEVLLEIRKKEKRFLHSELLRLYDEVIALTNSISDSDEWIDQIPEVIDSWRKNILSKA